MWLYFYPYYSFRAEIVIDIQKYTLEVHLNLYRSPAYSYASFCSMFNEDYILWKIIYIHFYIFSKENFFSISANQKQELHMAIMLLSNRDEMRKSHRMPSIGASYKMSMDLVLEKSFFLPIPKQNCIWRPY